VLVFLLLRQVMPIAAALAGGIALSTFGAANRLVSWGMRQGTSISRGAVALGAGALQSAPAPSVSSFTVTRSSWRVS
jgi:type IV secretion system protein VirB6